MTKFIEISSFFHKDEDIELVHRSSSFESGMSPFGIDHPTSEHTGQEHHHNEL